MPLWMQYRNTTEEIAVASEWIDITNQCTNVSTAIAFDSNESPRIVSTVIAWNTADHTSQFLRVTYTLTVTTGRFVSIGAKVKADGVVLNGTPLPFVYELDGTGVVSGVALLETPDCINFESFEPLTVAADGWGVGTLVINKVEVKKREADPTIANALPSLGLFSTILNDYTSIDPEQFIYNHQFIRANPTHENYQYLVAPNGAGTIIRAWLNKSITSTQFALEIVFSSDMNETITNISETQDGDYYVCQVVSGIVDSNPDRYLKEIRAVHVAPPNEYPYEQIGIVAVRVDNNPILQFPKLTLFYDDVISV